MFKIRFQMFASLDEIIEANKDSFEGEEFQTSFGSISEKLSGLGYDVLLNHKEKAEFVPYSRLSEVVGQRDTFKGKVEELNSQLQKMKDGAGDNKELTSQIQNLMDTNQTLLADLEKTKINSEIMLSAKDAIAPKDILAFVDMNNIKVNAKGEVLGVESEINRLKIEKPYLFLSDEAKKKKAGGDPGGDGSQSTQGGMNAILRRAAGRL